MKPINSKFILANFNTKKVLSIEENSSVGGLSSILSSIYVKKQLKNIKFESISLKDTVHKSIGSQKHLRDINMLSSEKIYKLIIKYLNA